MIKLLHIDYEVLPDFIKVITQSGYKVLVEESEELNDMFDTLFFDASILTRPEDSV